MRKIISLFLVAMILAMSFSACGKKEETQTSAPVEEKTEDKKEETYRTEEFCGCKFSVPDTWVSTVDGTKLTYMLDENNQIMVDFTQVEIGENEWDERVKAAADFTNGQNGAVHVDKYSPVSETNNPAYYLEGSISVADGTYPYESYMINLNNIGMLVLQNLSTDIQKESDHVKNIVDTLDASGVADYLGISTDVSDNADVNDVAQEFEVAIDVTGRWEDSKVVFELDTNLPDEAELMFTLGRGDYNTDDYFTAQDKGVIVGGHITTGGFSSSGEALSGDYDLCISMSLPRLQPDHVRNKIGEHGEYMTGPLVEASDITNDNTVNALFSVSVGDEIKVAPEDDYSYTIFRTAEEEGEPTEEQSQESSAEANKEFIEKYDNEIVAAAKMSLNRYLSDYKMSLAPQNWTMAKFDDTDTVIASTEITYNGAKATYYYVGTLNFNESGMVESSTPHYLSVGDAVIADDGYCNDVFEAIGALTSEK